MPCYHPMRGYRSRTVNASGKRSIVFNYNQGYKDLPVEVPCGQCIGCRLERSRQWAIRCVHEASLYKNNCFLTLTYSPENLPSDNSLHVEDFQKFMKRLRKRFGRNIRYFHCGEYGENFGRPHYHAIIFNFDFKDKKLAPIRQHEDPERHLYVSKELQKLWPFGFSTIGNVTFESAAYVARYVTKKVTGKAALHHYNQIDPDTGEILQERKPEYVTMSQGIGRDWLKKWKTDVYPDDFIILRGKKLTVPKYYNTKFEIEHPNEYKKIKANRINKSKQNAENNTRDRLDVREEIQHSKFTQLKRKLT